MKKIVSLVLLTGMLTLMSFNLKSNEKIHENLPKDCDGYAAFILELVEAMDGCLSDDDYNYYYNQQYNACMTE